MKRYKEYKDSNFSGMVPADWRCWKLRHAYNVIGSGTTPEAGNPVYYDNGTINWLNTGDLNNSILKSCTKKVTPKALEDFSALKLFPKYSLAIAMYGATIGKVSLLEFETTVNQACCVFSNSEVVSNEFMFYWFLAHTIHIVNLSKGGGQPNISKEILSSLKIFCPSVSEQNQVVRFLDHKTAQIDKLISDKEKLIELLDEERTAIINQAVTKGLNPDVPMKDSGIEWLGKVPEHWEVLSFRFCITLLTDFTANGSFASLAENVTYLDKGYSRLIRLTDLRTGLSNDGVYVDEQAHNFLRKSQLKGGELRECLANCVSPKLMLLRSCFVP